MNSESSSEAYLLSHGCIEGIADQGDEVRLGDQLRHFLQPVVPMDILQAFGDQTIVFDGVKVEIGKQSSIEMPFGFEAMFRDELENSESETKTRCEVLRWRFPRASF